MFSYYGSKGKIVDYYPPPKHKKIIEPFAGSGTEVAMAIKEGRQAIGFDVKEKYCQMSNDRIKKVLSMPELFV